MGDTLNKLTFTGPPILGGWEFPYPSKGSTLQPEWIPNHIVKVMDDGSLRIKKRRWVGIFRLGWRGLSQEDMENLILAYEKGSVIFIPRSKKSTDANDPGEAEPYQYEVRFVSQFPFDTSNRPNHGTYDIEIELETVTAKTAEGDTESLIYPTFEALIHLDSGTDFASRGVIKSSKDGTNIQQLNNTSASDYRCVGGWDETDDRIWFTRGGANYLPAAGGSITNRTGGANGDGASMDAVNRLLYYTRSSTSTGAGCRVFKVDIAADTSVLLHDFGVDRNATLGFDIPNGDLYALLYDTSPLESKLYKVHIDGSGATLIKDFGGIVARGLACDIQRDAIYFIQTAPEEKVQKLTVSTGAVEDVLVITGVNLFVPEIDIDGANEKLYWSEPGNGIIRRSGLDGSDAETIIQQGGTARPYGLKLVERVY